MQNGRKISVLLMLIAGIECISGAATVSSNAAPRVETISSGPVELIITADPPQVHLDRDILLSIKTITPSNITVHLPTLDNRLAGFVLSGSFDREPVAQNKNVIREHCYRLTPLISAEYRLAPMAVTYTDSGRPTITENWFATRAMLFEVSPIVSSKPGTAIRDIRGPVWIYPPFKMVLLWVGALVLMVVAVWALYRLSRRIHRAIQLHRMSPRERALVELAELMARNLIAKDQVKEFFMGLTLIVRRYIERAHGIRAPEQTTEEFLLAATHNPQFRSEVVRKLRTFLQNADLVKFAAYRPEPDVVDRAFSTAKDYVETDEQALGTDQTTDDRRRTTDHRPRGTRGKLQTKN